MSKYNIIYADPPWSYNQRTARGSAEHHYPTMSQEDLKNLPISEIAEKDCTLFMWATFPMIKEALELIEAWGFRYKTTAFVWAKKNRKFRFMVHRSRILDEEQCRDMPACRQGESEKAVTVRQSAYRFPARGAFQEARRNPRPHSKADGRPPPRRAVRKAENRRLGRVGQRGRKRYIPQGGTP